MKMKEYVFTTAGPNITAQVVPTMEALGEQDWQVTLLDSYGKQIEYRVVYAASGLEAATEAVNDWLEANGLDISFSVSL